MQDQSSKSGRRKGQERLIDLFHAEGVSLISGIVDVHFMEFHRAAVDRGMRMMGTRHEISSVMIAEAASRMLGRPQVAMAAYGPGVANMVGGVVTAMEERVPLIVLVSGRGFHTRSVVRNGKYQYWSQIDVFRQITKYAAVVEDIRQLDAVVHEAFRQATSGTPGPVYIEVPVDIMWGELEFLPAPQPAAYREVTPQPASEELVDKAANLLARARLPVILAGQAIHTARGHAELKRVARLLKCPVVTSFGAKGALPDNDPQALSFGFAGANEACRDADVVLAVGTSIGEPLLCGEPPRWGDYGEQQWIHVERNAERLHTNRRAEVPLVGDLKAVLPQLYDSLEALGPFEQPPELERFKQQQDGWRQQIAADSHAGAPIHPGHLMLAVRNAVPDQAVTVRDGGCTALWELCLYEQRSNDFLWTSHCGHLGSGLPYAIGAQFAVGRERPVVLISGDGALGFQIMEFETAVRENLPVCVVVNCDHTWGMELMDFYEGPDSIETCPGVSLSPARYDQMAVAMGGHGEYVEDPDEIGPAVSRAFASGKPAIVQVMTDVNINANTLQLPAVDELLSFYYLDGNKGYGHFKDL
jgi:thiamine pyrophosphate-dependent acetolactate synthase large subunit-like protein